MRKVFCLRIISGLLSIVLFCHNCVLAHAAETNFWAERSASAKASADKSAGPAVARPPPAASADQMTASRRAFTVCQISLSASNRQTTMMVKSDHLMPWLIQ